MARHWIYLRLFHILLDALGIYGAFVLAYFLRVGWIFSTDFRFEPYALFAGGAAVLWIAFLLLSKYYRIPPRHGSRRAFDFVLIFLSGAVAISFLLVGFFFVETFFSRLILLYAFVFSSAFLIITGDIFRLILMRSKKARKHVYRVLIIGANRVAEKLIHAIDTNPYAPYHIIGVIDPYGLTKDIRGSRILGKLDRLEDICKKEKITAIIQCDAFEHTLNLISFCDEKDIKFQFDPALRGIFEENLRIREVAGVTMISFVQRDYTGMKRLRFRAIDWVLRQVFDVD